MKIFKRKINRLNQRGDTLTSIFVSLVVIAAVIMTASYLLIRSSNLAQATRETTQINQLLASQVEALKNKVYTDRQTVFSIEDTDGNWVDREVGNKFCFDKDGVVVNGVNENDYPTDCDSLQFLDDVASLKFAITYYKEGRDTTSDADDHLFEFKAKWTPVGGGNSTDMIYYYRIHPVETTTNP